MADSVQNIDEIEQLERQVAELINLTRQLNDENKALRVQQGSWTVERARLIEKNDLAKTQNESMILRLRSLEKG